MFEFLKSHPFFTMVEEVDNTDGKHYQYYDHVKYLVYQFIEPTSQNGTLYLYIPKSEGEFQWIYFYSKIYFIQKIACPSSNGPKWMQELINTVENVS